MKFFTRFSYFTAVFLILVVSVIYLNNKNKISTNNEMPVFTLATSEYPSWSTFVVAQKLGLIGKPDGEPGTLEYKWGVRVKLEVKDYDPCLTMFASGKADAVCMTNIDALNPALSRSSTVIIPTSTSEGGDKVIGCGIENLESLKGQKTYGLSKSVSEFVFVLGIQNKGLNVKDYPFVNLEPAAAATAMQSGSKEIKSVCIWNPYALQTLRNQTQSKTLFDSSVIPETVIDCVVVGNDSLNKKGGENFACLIAEAFYKVCEKMDNSSGSGFIYKSLGEEFSNLNEADMRIVCTETRFYKNPQAGMDLFRNSKFQQTTMPLVVKTCQNIGILEPAKTPTVGFNNASKQLNFTTVYMQKVASNK